MRKGRLRSSKGKHSNPTRSHRANAAPTTARILRDGKKPSIYSPWTASSLLPLLFAQEADFAPDADRQTAGLRLILDQPETGHIDCAVTADGIIGMVSILFTVSTAEGGRAAWLEDLILHPEWRAIGVGDRLLREAIHGAKLAGCKRLTLLTDESNTVAMRGYARAGFVRSRMVPMRLMLCRSR